MKRSDLKVGGAYYYSRRHDWAAPKYDGADGEKAVILDLDAPDGKVLAEVHHTPKWAPEPYTTTQPVPLAQLRGPWEQTRAQVAEFVRQRDEQRKREHAASTHRAAAAEAAYQRASGLGFKASMGFGSNLGGVWLPAAEVQRLLDAYEAAPKQDTDAGRVAQ